MSIGSTFRFRFSQCARVCMLCIINKPINVCLWRITPEPDPHKLLYTSGKVATSLITVYIYKYTTNNRLL